jgi:threonyl-tRNA synthetase
MANHQLIKVCVKGEIMQVKPDITGAQIIKQIPKNNDYNIVGIRIDGKVYDLRDEIKTTDNIDFIITGDEQGLEILRHDLAHILAQAILNLYPESKFGIGPATEFGFFYDVLCAETIKQENLVQIEEEMHKIINQNLEITKLTISKEEAKNIFTDLNQPYKIKLIEGIDENEKITLYKQGNFIDLCKGPHGLTTGYPKYFRITNISGVYWKGNKEEPMMQRIYATGWAKKQDLTQYLKLKKEAEKRDHRKLGQDLELFHFQEEAQGMVFWHNKGFQILLALQTYIRKKQNEYGYSEVQTPILCSDTLWHKSGHMEKFAENMFFVKTDNQSFALKPMNCPCHIEIFKRKQVSYKNLPIRMSEFGRCHRNESSGALHGLMRVKSLVQDDAHIFCTEEQIMQETLSFFQMVKEIYKDFGFHDFAIKFATRPKIRAGDDTTWDIAEKTLLEAIKATNIKYSLAEGEGAFYGPKIEFHLKDSLQRSWQCGTLQLDYVFAKRLDAYYTDENNSQKHPVILHRAVLGSFERFIGILLEEHAGKLPIWLAPIQVAIATITSNCIEFANHVCYLLKQENIRAIADTQNNTINYKIRHLITQKTPIIGIIGMQEVEKNVISVRGPDNKNTLYSINELIEYIKSQEKNR